jgi:F-type H+-transporting ATPase subunit b
MRSCGVKKVFLSIFMFFLPVVLVASEEGSEGHGGWFTPIWGVPAVIWQFINLAIVIALFYYLLRVRLPNAFRQKSIEIENALDKAKKEKQESLAMLKELEEKMAHLEEEVLKIETEAKESAEREKTRLTENAKESAEWLRKEADEEFNRREMEAERKLKTIVVEEALRIAGETVRENIGEDDEAKLFDRFSRELEDKLNG